MPKSTYFTQSKIRAVNTTSMFQAKMPVDGQALTRQSVLGLIMECCTPACAARCFAHATRFAADASFVAHSSPKIGLFF